jgi:hemin uptake protein HemP
MILKSIDLCKGCCEARWKGKWGIMTERRLSPRGADIRLTTDRSVSDWPRRVPLSTILGGDREIVIEFNGADYRLRITRNQKLILTK